MDQTIDISINKAKIASFSVSLEDEVPFVSATIDLLSGEKKISSFNVSTGSYSTHPFDLPPEMIDPILNISRQLQTITVRECNKELAQLPTPEEV